MMPAINSKNGSAALLAKPLIDPSKAARSTEKRDRISPRLVRAKKAAGKFWTCSNSRVRTSEISEAASLASQRSYQTATIEVKIPAAASTERILTSASKSSSPSASSIRNFRLSGMMTLNSVSTSDAEADKCQYLLVVLQERFDERIDRRQRAGGFLGGKDDEILIFLVIVELKLVVTRLLIVVIGRRHGLVAGPATATGSQQAAFRRPPPQRDRPRTAVIRSSDDGGLDAMKPTDAARPA